LPRGTGFTFLVATPCARLIVDAAPIQRKLRLDIAEALLFFIISRLLIVHYYSDP
jgi:hypothetical protein